MQICWGRFLLPAFLLLIFLPSCFLLPVFQTSWRSSLSPWALPAAEGRKVAPAQSVTSSVSGCQEVLRCWGSLLPVRLRIPTPCQTASVTARLPQSLQDEWETEWGADCWAKTGLLQPLAYNIPALTALGHLTLIKPQGFQIQLGPFLRPLTSNNQYFFCVWDTTKTKNVLKASCNKF